MAWLALHADEAGVVLRPLETMANYLPITPEAISRSVNRLLEEGILGDLRDRTDLNYEETRFQRVRFANGKVRKRALATGPGWVEAPEFLVPQPLRAVTRKVGIGERGTAARCP
jgi:hypothetical protein